ncbi:MAG: FtsX-like permease family protein [Pseudomonadota bacterium]
MNAALRIAGREIAGNLGRFRIYLACLALGAFSIAAAGSVAASFERGLAAQARVLLGGDAAFALSQRRASADERAFMESRGRVSETVSVRLMGETSAARRLVDVAGVDAAFPLLGAPVLEGAPDLDAALAEGEGGWGAAVSASFLEAFDVEIGDVVHLGPVAVRAAALLVKEPNELGEPGVFAPRVIVRLAALEEAGLLSTGRLFRTEYLLTSDDRAALATLEADARAAWGEAGPLYRPPEEAVDGLQELLGLLGDFLATVGVVALIAGGVGIAQAAGGFFETRIGAIAAMKSLGADARQIGLIYGAQLTGLALLGAAAGAALGALAPFVLVWVAGERIPLPQLAAFYPGPVARALILTILTAAVFAGPALGRARATPPAALFRIREATESSGAWRRPESLAAAGAAALLVLVATLSSVRPLMTLALLIGAAVVYGALRALAWGVRRLAGLAARRAEGLNRLALSNLAGPGSLAPTVTPAFGLGLAMLALIAAVQANLLTQLAERTPEDAPSLFISQIPSAETDVFDATMRGQNVAIDDPDVYQRAPVVLGRISALKGEPLRRETLPDDAEWIADGELAFSYLAEQPPELAITEGKWWPADYSGPLLVSVEDDTARQLELSVGDEIGISVLGRELTARVASFRDVDWRGFGANVTFLFSPGTLEAANPRHFAIARVPPEAETAIIAALGAAVPEAVVFQTRGAIATFRRIVANISLAVTAAAGVVMAAGLLVLFGAFSLIARKRRVEAALLKTYGATRGGVLGLYAAEFALVGAASGLIGAGLGALGGYLVVTFGLELDWRFPWAELAAMLAAASVASAAGGAAAGWSALSRSTASALRTA